MLRGAWGWVDCGGGELKGLCLDENDCIRQCHRLTLTEVDENILNARILKEGFRCEKF